jgi:AcrR family transcriptional regulator
MGTGRPRSFDRDRALAIAMDMFWRRGFAATSIADLCAALAIAPPSLYAAFGSKESLYEECISYYMSNVAPRIWDGFRKAATARAAVEAFLRDSANVLPAVNKPAGCMVTLSDARGEGSERLGDFVEDARRQGQLLVERRISEAIATGEISSGANPAKIARYVLSVQQGMSVQARDGSTSNELREVACAAMEAWPALVRGRTTLMA